MCGIFSCTAFCITNTCIILLLAGILILEGVIISKLDGDDGPKSAEELLAIIASSTGMEGSNLLDISHYPSKPEEFFERRQLGNCCNDKCADDLCYTNTVYLASNDHCNRCCFHLTLNCTSGHVCRCYANDQSLDQ
jgi:hypothetical protein